MRAQLRFSQLILLGLLAAAVSAALSQGYPTRPIRIVTAGVGGGNDFVSRIIAGALSPTLGHTVVVENRGGGVIPGEVVSKSPPDGYTVLVMSTGLWLGQFLRSSVPYDVNRDFAPITLIDRAPNILVVHKSLPAASVKELIALAKKNPGQLNVSSAALGSSSHLAGELFKALAGVKMTNVPYKSGAQETNDLIAGIVQLAFGTASTVIPHVKSGRLRALAVTSAEPSPLAPGLPSIASAGLPGYEMVSIHAAFVPAKTPAPIVEKLNLEIGRVLNRPDVKEKFFNAGIEAIAGTPAELDTIVKSEMARLGKVIKDAGIREE